MKVKRTIFAHKLSSLSFTKRPMVQSFGDDRYKQLQSTRTKIAELLIYSSYTLLMTFTAQNLALKLLPKALVP